MALPQNFNYSYRGFWKQLTNILLFAFVLMVGYWCYLRYQGFDFASSAYLPKSLPNTFRNYQTLKDEEVTKQDISNKLRESDDLVRYEIARYINNKEKLTNWSDNINNLVRMYTELQSVARTTNNGIILSDFTIEKDTIQVRGQIQELKFMYIKNGIIDRFSALEFVDNITIPYYQKNGAYFDFVLKADVVNTKDMQNTNQTGSILGTGS